MPSEIDDRVLRREISRVGPGEEEVREDGEKIPLSATSSSPLCEMKTGLRAVLWVANRIVHLSHYPHKHITHYGEEGEVIQACACLVDSSRRGSPLQGDGLQARSRYLPPRPVASDRPTRIGGGATPCFPPNANNECRRRRRYFRRRVVILSLNRMIDRGHSR